MADQSSLFRRIGGVGGRRWRSLAAAATAVAACLVVWRFHDLLGPQTVTALIDRGRGDPLLPAYCVAIFILSSFVVFPVSIAIAATVALLPGATGVATAAAGVLSAALLNFAIGRAIGPALLRRLPPRAVAAIADRLRRRSIVAIVILRLLPFAPFALTNFAAGALRVRTSDYLLGTVLGLGPVLLGYGLLGATARAVMSGRGAGAASGLAIAALGLFALMQRARRRRSPSPAADRPAADRPPADRPPAVRPRGRLRNRPLNWPRRLVLFRQNSGSKPRVEKRNGR